MTFTGVTIKSVKADLAKDEITISIIVDRNAVNMELAGELASVCVGKDASSAKVEITPNQPKLL